MVRYGRSVPHPPFHVVTADQVLNTMLAFEKIRGRGYKRIGFVDCRESTVKAGHLFLAGFLDAQMALDEKLRIPVLNLGLIRGSGRHKQLTRWIKKYRIEAILTGFKELPSILTEAGLRVPDDVALAGTTVLDTAISAGINQHPHEIGRVGFLLLNSLYQRPRHRRPRNPPPVAGRGLVGRWRLAS